MLQQCFLPSSFGYNHLRAHLVELYPQFSLVQVDFDSLHALQNKTFLVLCHETVCRVSP